MSESDIIFPLVNNSIRLEQIKLLITIILNFDIFISFKDNLILMLMHPFCYIIYHIYKKKKKKYLL